VSSIDFARETLKKEIVALEDLMKGLGPAFDTAVDLILAAAGKVVTSGLGKSGIVAGKVAATFSSTGTPAIFLHPVEAMHGDIGVVQKNDIGLLFSNSGGTREVLDVFQAFKRLGLKTIAVVGRKGCSLGEFADCRLDASVKEEACPLNLAPTSSVIVALALGDALAACLIRRRGFTEEDYSRLHPSGSLGKKLLLRVGELMHGGDNLPHVAMGTPMAETLYILTSKAMGAVIVTDASRVLRGIYTDGDLKRTIRERRDIFAIKVDEVMTSGPVSIREDRLAVEALALMENRPSQISVLPVVDAENRVVGILRLHDLVLAGI